ncbi:sporulation integral membrane protein YlbJ [Gracilibacillus dipsosauri]|uniref:sporulation integral membrane protein YlbJ n=1 Tax=Gracilibacillus dipsosauri TaxID=178340 RepID=UPI00240967E2
MKQKIISIIYASFIIFIAASVIYFPQTVLSASKRGLEMWAGVVFPSLLPFFIVAELFIAFGVVHFIGVLCEPFMRPLFNVPGVGGFVWVMGMASGYPSGAKFTARLRQEGQLSQIEAERLVSFTNSSNPLFIIGAVAIGFFHDQQLGILLALTHYISNFFVGICMRFYKKNEREHCIREPFSIKRAFQKLHQTRMKDKRPFGKILGDAVIHSIQTLLLIGGFIILFSVLINIIQEVKLALFFSHFIGVILNFADLPKELAIPVLSGLFEITLGAHEIALVEKSSMLMKAIVMSFILAFNGMSVQAQVASILAETDIRFRPYFFARLIHGLISCIVVIVLFQPIYQQKSAIHTFSQQGVNYLESSLDLLQATGIPLTLMALVIYFFLMFQQKN